MGVSSIILTLPLDRRLEAEIGNISIPWLHFSLCFATGRQNPFPLTLTKNNCENEK